MIAATDLCFGLEFVSVEVQIDLRRPELQRGPRHTTRRESFHLHAHHICIPFNRRIQILNGKDEMIERFRLGNTSSRA